MLDIAAEIKGTMARTSQKRNTMLNVYLREKAKKEKGMATEERPKNTSDCTILPSARRFLHEVSREISHAMGKIVAMDLGKGDDVDAVRQLNNVINRLLRERDRWQRRVSILAGSAQEEEPDVDGDLMAALTAKSKKAPRLFFGAAKLLPEARKQQEESEFSRKRKAPDETQRLGGEAEEVDDEAGDKLRESGSTSSSDDNSPVQQIPREYFAPCVAADDERLLRIEHEADIAFQKQEQQKITSFFSPREDASQLVYSIMTVPTNEEVSTEMVNRRKKQLLEKLHASNQVVSQSLT